jgi:hypothetical protein
MGAVKAIGTAREGANLAIDAFGSPVREPGGHVGEDAVGVFADGGRDPLERRKARTSRPPDPLVELDAREPCVPTVEDADQGVLEQVGSVPAPHRERRLAFW